MSVPTLSFVSSPSASESTHVRVLLLPSLSSSPEGLTDWKGLADALEAIGFTGAANTVARVHLPSVVDGPFAVAGLGDDVTTDAVRQAAGTAARTLTGFDRLSFQMLSDDSEREQAALEGAGLGAYAFDSYKTTAAPARAQHIDVVSATLSAEDAAAVARRTDAVALVKDLVNIPAEWLSPEDVVARATELVAELPVEVTVYDEKDLADKGFGGILGVGQGSERPPRLVRLDYAPEGATRHVALVGKGITFDTGGLSLKPAAAMVGMKYDMCGAATVLSVLRAVAEEGAAVRVTAWLCLADNMPSGRATRPGDVLRMYGGTTVEVLNTDAEGRLVLGDGLVAASEEHPDLVIDVATLTGAITVALGNRHVGVMGEDNAVAEYLRVAAAEDELAWSLPLPEYMKDDLDSPIADLQNAKIGDPAGGSMFAGLFLQHFVGRVSEEEGAPRIPWVHLDIANVGWHKGSPYGYVDKGPTGATVRSLISLITKG